MGVRVAEGEFGEEGRQLEEDLVEPVELGGVVDKRSGRVRVDGVGRGTGQGCGRFYF